MRRLHEFALPIADANTRRFDASYAINSLAAEDVQKLAPKSYSDLLANVPGIHVESTGGEVQNITRLRGIPTDRGYIIFQQDGLPLFHEIDGHFFNSGEGMHRFDLMNQRVEVVRGGPAPIYASGGAAIVNNILAEGSEQTRGGSQLTLGDTGLYRAEAFQSGALSQNTYYAVDGFVRHHDGYRDNGFADDKGSQLRANLKHDLDDGWVKVSATLVDDHNVFKSGYTQGKLSFDALYSTTNPVDGNAFASSYLERARNAFGAGVAPMRYVLAGTDGATAHDPNSASGLVISGQYRAIESEFYSAQADLSGASEAPINHLERPIFHRHRTIPPDAWKDRLVQQPGRHWRRQMPE